MHFFPRGMNKWAYYQTDTDSSSDINESLINEDTISEQVKNASETQLSIVLASFPIEITFFFKLALILQAYNIVSQLEPKALSAGKIVCPSETMDKDREEVEVMEAAD